ncbi:MAG TPA: lipocalin family protein [Phenylobacterium sp.]|uniref:lipocalin family protein n=1 Tax=Phenylobacterium sp. TaxID=1871053 RepID=UPI002D10950B|nr:lipocalin family protein [Phenylobacterium sp.]HSV04782.1 lipocalin family protein [Phenylobacterium sp.]
MLKRILVSAAALAACSVVSPALAAPAAAAPRIELAQMTGRWYEVARTPNQLQRGCEAGTSDWTRSPGGFAVVQACHKGAPDGPVSQWRARARVADPVTNSVFKMSFFGGLVSKEYRVLDHRPDQGWLILATDDGHYLWLMSQKPTLPAAIRAQALARIKQLGFDVGRLEFPPPPRS